MPHARQTLRDAVTAAVTGLTTTGARVYQTRVYPLDRGSQLPGLAVYTLNEEAPEDGLQLDDEQVRDLTVAIAAYAQATDGADDTLDTIDAEVAAALYAAFAAGSLTGALSLDWQSWEAEEPSDELEQPVQSAVTEYRIRYCVDAADPTTVIT